ncbi:hypothetical protein [Rhizobium terrae]|uniref:hypothetical protein n=1 Tax=Rhizobium terrae TaxID=2171756 RepID=UPI000E3D810C|nr:hypothetical protein [Rhizobium terrae]
MLRRNSNAKSYYVAVCHDVVSGIPVEDAFSKNGPLPEVDEVHAMEVEGALKHATPDHLADLAAAFGARRGPAFKEALTGVAWAAINDGPERLSSANIDHLARLADAFTKNDIDDDATEAVAMQVAVRGNDLLPQANIGQIATLTLAFCGRDDSEFQDETNFHNAMGKLALRVTAHGDELLRAASAEQLATLKGAFGGPAVQLATREVPFEPAEADHPEAFAKVVNEMKSRDEAARLAHNSQLKLQLADRALSVER